MLFLQSSTPTGLDLESLATEANASHGGFLQAAGDAVVPTFSSVLSENDDVNGVEHHLYDADASVRVGELLREADQVLGNRRFESTPRVKASALAREDSLAEYTEQDAMDYKHGGDEDDENLARNYETLSRVGFDEDDIATWARRMERFDGELEAIEAFYEAHGRSSHKVIARLLRMDPSLSVRYVITTLLGCGWDESEARARVQQHVEDRRAQRKERVAGGPKLQGLSIDLNELQSAMVRCGLDQNGVRKWKRANRHYPDLSTAVLLYLRDGNDPERLKLVNDVVRRSKVKHVQAARALLNNDWNVDAARKALAKPWLIKRILLGAKTEELKEVPWGKLTAAQKVLVKAGIANIKAQMWRGAAKDTALDTVMAFLLEGFDNERLTMIRRIEELPWMKNKMTDKAICQLFINHKWKFDKVLRALQRRFRSDYEAFKANAKDVRSGNSKKRGDTVQRTMSSLRHDMNSKADQASRLSNNLEEQLRRKREELDRKKREAKERRERERQRRMEQDAQNQQRAASERRAKELEEAMRKRREAKVAAQRAAERKAREAAQAKAQAAKAKANIAALRQQQAAQRRAAAGQAQMSPQQLFNAIVSMGFCRKEAAFGMYATRTQKTVQAALDAISQERTAAKQRASGQRTQYMQLWNFSKGKTSWMRVKFMGETFVYNGMTQEVRMWDPRPVPVGWGWRVTPKFDKCYFLNHSTRSTTWTDPRQPPLRLHVIS
eukprot:TRINITY_DN59931_c0_g1_i1.p1 TRINITY_DN59931_c0_g1~~TRINITY_DN59931_c0_g1_i1.p1  ORF type:complete len:725 (+),score=396.15 TRINITY_DN59931_c0_g1_i1:26-2200(+)